MGSPSLFQMPSPEVKMVRRKAPKASILLAALAVFSAVLPGSIAGQDLWLDSGVSFPTGRFGGYAGSGWLLMVGGSLPLEGRPRLGVAAEVFRGGHGLDLPGDKATLLGGLVGLEYQPETRLSGTVVVLAEFGFLKRKEESRHSSLFNSDDSGLAFTAGARYCVPLMAVQGCVAGRLLGGLVGGADGNPTVLSLTAGVRVPLDLILKPGEGRSSPIGPPPP